MQLSSHRAPALLPHGVIQQRALSESRGRVHARRVIDAAGIAFVVRPPRRQRALRRCQATVDQRDSFATRAIVRLPTRLSVQSALVKLLP